MMGAPKHRNIGIISRGQVWKLFGPGPAIWKAVETMMAPLGYSNDNGNAKTTMILTTSSLKKEALCSIFASPRPHLV